MGARLVVTFANNIDAEPAAHVYLHWGGETAGEVAQTMQSFFDRIETLSDPRRDDMPYLAAKMVVWAADEHRRGDDPLDFLSVGVVGSDDWGDAHVVVTSDGWHIQRALGYGVAAS
jgi:hypothetical protein